MDEHVLDPQIAHVLHRETESASQLGLGVG